MPAADPIRPVIYGKVPWKGDFIRHNATGEAFEAFDSWVQHGVGLARRQFGNRFSELYGAMGPWLFQFSAAGQASPFSGLMIPGSDSVGRAYPLTLAVEQDAHASAGNGAPMFVHEERASGIERAANLLREGDSDLENSAASVGRLFAGPAAVMADPYARFLREFTMGDLSSEIWPNSDGRRKAFLFANLTRVLEPLQQDPDFELSLGLKFPLPAARHVRLAAARFWLEACRRVSGCSFESGTFFVEYGDVRAPQMYVYLRTPSNHTFAHMLDPAYDSERMCPLEYMGTGSAEACAAALRSIYGSLFETPELSPGEFLKGLARRESAL